MKNVHDLVEAAKAHVREIPLEKSEQAIEQADVLIDVREADEFHAGHIPGALNIPRGILEFKLTNDPAFENRGLNIVIYCKNSGRSALSAKAMKEMGYMHVQSIAGGIEAWQEAGKRVIKPELPDFD
ncbi:rhodanese-like domain-containing protein [Marinobacter sp. 2_MG-2023]|uniref:rhodanese-like domain-containing protein n=1 Tax=Marinobacter sp. 2_MG-2023 TaxID=3062679 RepID=UPI0026E3FB5B|nr:rhodanese-like domain-containing protein [Marinobacter sp. 2_MG-2023]MDO6442226.1 rhodanese-like domain-containing protein [Marinobacter sp. 2_MG-2023]